MLRPDWNRYERLHSPPTSKSPSPGRRTPLNFSRLSDLSACSLHAQLLECLAKV